MNETNSNIILDARSSEDVYRQALKLAREKHLLWSEDCSDDPDYFDRNNAGLVMFKLFSKLTETAVTRVNIVPEKHRLAFFDFMGIDSFPPSSARVPLTFYPAKGAASAYVPVATPTAHCDDPEIVFQTESNLTVADAKLSSLFSLNPWADKYTDHSDYITGKEEGFTVFGEDAEERPLEHTLYICCDLLFDIRRPATLTVSFKGGKLEEKFFSSWCCGGKEVAPNISSFPKVSLNIEHIERAVIDGCDGFWVSLSPHEDATVIDDGALPSLEAITVDVNVPGIKPENLICGNIPADYKKGFYPFGEMPKAEDALYIGCREAFSRVGADISIALKLAKALATADAVLVWEYWDGEKWNSLAVKDDKNGSAINLRDSGIVTFSYPASAIEPAKIGGSENRWIRVRIESGGYGSEGKYVESKSLEDIFKNYTSSISNSDQLINGLRAEGYHVGVNYEFPAYDPPFISSIDMGYEYKGRSVERIKTYNNFKYEDVDLQTGWPFKPYKSVSEDMPGLYLGFENNPADTPFSLFFVVKERPFGEPHKVIEAPVGSSGPVEDAAIFQWQLRQSGTWTDLRSDDETNCLASGGIVTFQLPARLDRELLFGKELYWVRASFRGGKRIYSPSLKGVYPNTVWAENALLTEDEIIGSGTGAPLFTARLSKKNILEGQIVEIDEGSLPPAEERRIIEAEEGENAIRVETNDNGEIVNVWVRWHEVRDFSGSAPVSRHYVIDRINGEATFGDGKKGALPPKGKNNIVARRYCSGGGFKGNVQAGTLSKLKKAIPSIDSVVNHADASGGKNNEDVHALSRRAPHSIKNRGRAVTSEDFEFLVMEYSHDIAKVKCVNEGGRVKVIIAPHGKGAAPMPDASLADAVEKYLRERALLTIGGLIEVAAPDYRRIGISVVFRPELVSEGGDLSERIREKLADFLHPLKGGADKSGWDFGESIYVSDIASVAEGVNGVDYVKSIEATEEYSGLSVEGIGCIEMDERSLPCAGSIIVRVEA